MWTRIFLLAALTAPWLGALSGDVAFAQDARSSRCPKTVDGDLLSQIDWLRLDITGGRITLACYRYGQARVRAEPTEASPWLLVLAVSSQPEWATVEFTSVDDHEQILFRANDRQEVTITRQKAEVGAVYWRYSQPSIGPVVLSIGAEEPRKYSAASLWHLLVAEPTSREHLLPVLARIRPAWRLSQQLGEMENALVAAAGIDATAERRKWQTWVDQLADPSFARRCEADQALRAAGLAVLAQLRQLDPATLDREQRERIRAILAANAHAGPDSPERVAGWLADDKRVWLALLSRSDQATSLAAAGHLSLLSGKPISIDPSASDERRAQQIVELKALLAEN